MAPLGDTSGLVGGLLKSYLGGITGGAVGSGGSADSNSGPGGNGSPMGAAPPPQQQQGMQPQQGLLSPGQEQGGFSQGLQNAGSNLMNAAAQRSPAIGLLSSGYDAYQQGAQNGGGFSGGMQQVGSNLQGQGQQYLDSMTSLFR